MVRRINTKALIIIIIIALVITDAYSIYTYLLSPPLPYVRVLGYYGDYDAASVYKGMLVLYDVSLASINLKGVNITSGKYIWIDTIYIPGLLPLIRFIPISNKLFVATYSLYGGGIYDDQESPIVANVTMINIFTGKIINYTVLAAVSSTRYYMAMDAIGDDVYVVIIPLSDPLRPVNTTIIDLRLLGREPYSVEVWRTEVVNSRMPLSIVTMGIKRFGNYVLVTVSCNDKPLTYMLNASNGKLMLRADVGSGVYGIAGDTLIYKCGGKICGLDFISNRTWKLPIIGSVTSITISGDRALVLITTGYTIWVYGISSNGSLIFRRELWTYTAPLMPCSVGGLRYTFMAKSYPIRDYALIIILPEGIRYISGGGFGCMPQSIVILNPSNGHVVVSVTKPAWIAYLYAYPYSFNNLWQALDINYLSNDYVVYSINNALNSRTFHYQYSYYLTTPKAITNEW